MKIRIRKRNGTEIELEGTLAEIKEGIKLADGVVHKPLVDDNDVQDKPELPVPRWSAPAKEDKPKVVVVPQHKHPVKNKHGFKATPKELRDAISSALSSRSSVKAQDIARFLGYSSNAVYKRLISTAKRMGFSVVRKRPRVAKYGRPNIMIERPAKKLGKPFKVADNMLFDAVMNEAKSNGMVNMKRVVSKLGYSVGGKIYKKIKNVFDKHDYDIVSVGSVGTKGRCSQLVKRSTALQIPKPSVVVIPKKPFVAMPKSVVSGFSNKVANYIRKHFAGGYDVLYVGDMINDLGSRPGSTYLRAIKVAKKEGFHVEKANNRWTVYRKKPVESKVVDTVKKPFRSGAGIYAKIMERFDQFPDKFTVSDIWKLVSPIPKTSSDYMARALVSSNISATLRSLCNKPVGHRKLKVIKTIRSGKAYYNVYLKVREEPVVIPIISEGTLLKVFHDDEYLGFDRNLLMSLKARDGSRINDLQAQILMKWICDNRDYIERLTGRKLKVVGDKVACQVVPKEQGGDSNA